MAKKRKGGRPATFSPAARRELAELIRQYGARRARELSPMVISLGTLLKIAKEFDIELRKGRRRKKAA
jgi:hypothetical protein